MIMHQYNLLQDPTLLKLRLNTKDKNAFFSQPQRGKLDQTYVIVVPNFHTPANLASHHFKYHNTQFHDPS